MQKLAPVTAARNFVARHFPECAAAFLGASVLGDQATRTSDLDIVVVTTRAEAPFRNSHIEVTEAGSG